MPETRRFDENDPLAVEQRSHEKTKEHLATVSRRALELHEKAKRSLSAEAVDAVLEEAVARERIWPDDVDEWRRKLEDSPSETIVELAQEREMTAAELEADTRRIMAQYGLSRDEAL